MNKDKTHGYWKYHSDSFDWNQSPGLELVDKQHTLKVLKDSGINDKTAIQLWESGYVCVKGHDIVIDRYYGGAISSCDMVSRLIPSQLNELFDKPRSRAWVKSASSLDEVKKIVDDTQSRLSRPMNLRGQRQNYFIDREINNPNFTIDGLGEISILSSFWRKVFLNTKKSFVDFETLSLFEWSNIFYNAFDLEEIERRQKISIDNGEWMYSMQDMADSDDPLLSEFGNHRLDLSMGMNFNLADTLSTLLQHYGLLSTVIDLTSSLDVALFFATHKYTSHNGQSNYDFVGTNNGKAVLYLIGGSDREMVRHEHDRVLDKIPPERPHRQHCVISRSSSLAVNLPAFFLEGVINLDFELDESDSPKTVEDLFPPEADDKFLKALMSGIHFPEKVSCF